MSQGLHLHQKKIEVVFQENLDEFLCNISCAMDIKNI